MENNTTVITDQVSLSNVEDIRKAITIKHKKVSFMKTPKPFIKQRAGDRLCRVFIYERNSRQRVPRMVLGNT